MNKHSYKDFLNNNITEDYKKVDDKIIDEITKNDKVSQEAWNWG